MAAVSFANIDTEKTSRLISDAMTGEIQEPGRYVLEFSVGAVGSDGTVFVKEDILLMTHQPPVANMRQPVTLAPDDSKELERLISVLGRARNYSKRLRALLYVKAHIPEALTQHGLVHASEYAETIDDAIAEALKNDIPF